MCTVVMMQTKKNSVYWGEKLYTPYLFFNKLFFPMELEINVVGMDQVQRKSKSANSIALECHERNSFLYILYISTKGKLLLKKKKKEKKFLRRAARWHSPHFRKLYSQKYAGVISFPDMKSFRFEFFFLYSIFGMSTISIFRERQNLNRDGHNFVSVQCTCFVMVFNLKSLGIKLVKILRPSLLSGGRIGGCVVCWEKNKNHKEGWREEKIIYS